MTKEEKYRAQYLLFTNKPYEAGEEAQKQIDSSARAARTLNGRLLEVYDVVLDEKGYLVSGKNWRKARSPREPAGMLIWNARCRAPGTTIRPM